MPSTALRMHETVQHVTMSPAVWAYASDVEANSVAQSELYSRRRRHDQVEDLQQATATRPSPMITVREAGPPRSTIASKEPHHYEKTDPPPAFS